MSKRTAVDFLIDKFEEINQFKGISSHNKKQLKEYAINAAKELEQKQIERAFVSGEYKKYKELKTGNIIFNAPNDYYNETYNKQ